MIKCLVISGPARFEALAIKDDFASAIKKVAVLGYDGVEMAVRDPALVDAREIKRLLEELRLPLVAVGTGQAYGEEGLSFTDSDVYVRRKAVQRIKDQVEFAAGFGALVIIGLIRGKVQPGVNEEQASEWMKSALRDCADYGKRFDVGLVLEPINRYETNLINTVADALEMINSVGADNLKILFDTFHANIEEPSITVSIRNAAALLGHFHVADSNRWAPGCGHIEFPRIFSELRDIGYQGAVSAEIMPKPDPGSSARMAIEYLKNAGL